MNSSAYREEIILRQLRLFKKEKTEFGGSLLENKRKTSRPIALNTVIHLIVKGDITHSKSLLKHRKFIDEELQKWSQKFHVKLHSYAINHDHIHMAIEVSSKESYQQNHEEAIGQRPYFRKKKQKIKKQEVN